MNDERIWRFEKSLWTAGADDYRHRIADDGVMVVPERPFVMDGREAAQSMADTPRWESVEFSEQKVSRPDGPDGGLIVIAYKAEARKGDRAYSAYCTSTLLRQGEQDWVVVQHQQTLPPTSSP
jgi:hypothetical protein